MLDNDGAFSNPYFRPEYIEAVGRVRDDVEIAVIEYDNQITGFFPFQRRSVNIGEPVGGRLSDFQAIIGQTAGIDSAADLLRACGLSVWDFDHLLAIQDIFAPYCHVFDNCACIDLNEGWEAYVEAKRRKKSKKISRLMSRYRKMEREIGPLRFEIHTADKGLLNQVFEWKSQQYRNSGINDIFLFPWTGNLLTQILECQTDAFSGLLSVLYAGDRPVAIHFGMRSRDVLHYWFPVYDTALGKYSPGQLLLMEIMKAANVYGIRRIDLGRSADWKTQFMNRCIEVAEGSVDLRPVRGPMRSTWRHTKDWLRPRFAEFLF